jgi:hypothetical protein
VIINKQAPYQVDPDNHRTLLSMADNKETLAQAMYGKSQEDLEAEEVHALKELAGRGNQGVAIGMNEPGEAHAEPKNITDADADPDSPAQVAEDLHERGSRGVTTQAGPDRDTARAQYDQNGGLGVTKQTDEMDKHQVS